MDEEEAAHVVATMLENCIEPTGQVESVTARDNGWFVVVMSDHSQFNVHFMGTLHA